MSLDPIIQIIAEQTRDYPRLHRDRGNLVIHVVTVIAVWAGAIGLLLALKNRDVVVAALCFALAIGALAAQGWGHRFEKHHAPPFESMFEGAVRLVSENFFLFPRFALGGGLWRAWRESRWIALS